MKEKPTNPNLRGFKGIWIPKEVWLTEELNFQEKVLWAEINSLDTKDGCRASNKYFSKFLGLSEDRVRVYIARLKKKGYIYQESFNGRLRILRSNLEVVKRGKSKGADPVESRGQTPWNQGGDIDNKVYKKDNNISNNSKSKDLPRKKFRVSSKTYKEITDAYQEYKGIKLKGAEFGQVKQAIKTMIYSGRTKQNILDFMSFCFKVCNRIEQGDERVEKQLGWLKNWTMLTIKRKMPEFLAGKLQKDYNKEASLPPFVAKTFKKWKKSPD